MLSQVLAPLNARTIVPGHGPVGGPELIDDVLAYLRFVQQAAGLRPPEVARELDLGEFADLKDAERIVGNLHRAYAELDGLIDAGAALTDMVTSNGGKPLTCLA